MASGNKQYFEIMKSVLVLLFCGIIWNTVLSQNSKPNDRWFIQPQVFTGYTIGKYKSGFGYGIGIRCLYDFEKRFLGGPLFLGLETSFLSSLGFEHSENELDYSRRNNLIVSAVLEQNYKWFKYGFHIGTGIGYYFGIQDLNKNSIGMVTNIGWFPVYEGKAVTPYITYRNDWVFDRNKTNMQSISIGLNF
jgi:hypothetical protein